MGKATLVIDHNATVQRLAHQSRVLLGKKLGQPEFNNLLNYFDKQVNGEPDQVLNVLHKVPIGTLEYQFALCWLDNHGFGRLNVVELLDIIPFDSYTGNDCAFPGL